LLAGVGLPLVPHVLGLVVIALWVAIAAYDVRQTIVPDGWAYTAAIVAFGFSASYVPFVWSDAWFLFAGPLCALPLFALWLGTKGRGMGLGDAKLALSIGWLLGPLYGFVAVMWGFIIGAAWAVCILLPMAWWVRLFTLLSHGRLRGSSERFTMKSEVPFGPFLIAAALALWFLLLYHIPLPLL